MNEVINNTVNSQEEFTFPNLIPSAECKELLQIIKTKIKPHKIIFWLSLGAFMLFMILTMVFGIIAGGASFGSYDSEAGKWVYGQADYTGTIICAVLCSLSIIVGVVNLALSSKYSKNISALTGSIKINAQYSAFINQGYEKKEAYKLTLEWIDRQSNTAALNSIASTNALIAMSSISHINHN